MLGAGYACNVLWVWERGLWMGRAQSQCPKTTVFSALFDPYRSCMRGTRPPGAVQAGKWRLFWRLLRPMRKPCAR
ncbi:Uncharacterised protein [Bordetella pertussis]|nr:Uncharacterised protein [Bordetella pertussis]